MPNLTLKRTAARLSWPSLLKPFPLPSSLFPLLAYLLTLVSIAPVLRRDDCLIVVIALAI